MPALTPIFPTPQAYKGENADKESVRKTHEGNGKKKEEDVVSSRVSIHFMASTLWYALCKGEARNTICKISDSNRHSYSGSIQNFRFPLWRSSSPFAFPLLLPTAPRLSRIRRRSSQWKTKLSCSLRGPRQVIRERTSLRTWWRSDRSGRQ